MQSLEGTLEACDVTLMMEPLNRFETYFINRGDQALALAGLGFTQLRPTDIWVMLALFQMIFDRQDAGELAVGVGAAGPVMRRLLESAARVAKRARAIENLAYVVSANSGGIHGVRIAIDIIDQANFLRAVGVDILAGIAQLSDLACRYDTG